MDQCGVLFGFRAGGLKFFGSKAAPLHSVKRSIPKRAFGGASTPQDLLWMTVDTNVDKIRRPPGALRGVLQSCSVRRTGTAANPSLTHGEAVAARQKLGLGVG